MSNLQLSNFAGYRLFTFACLSLAIIGVFLNPVRAQDDASVAPDARSQLADEQKQISDRLSKLEELFLRMSELESTTNPARAGLLQQAAKLSKELSTTQRMASASELLTKRQFTRAIQEQQASRDSLKKLLELLQSENRHERLREDRAKYEEIIKEIQRIRRIQQSISGRSENVESMNETAQDQGNLADQADQIARKLADATNAKEEKGENASTKPSDDASKENETSKGKNAPKESNSKSQSSKPSDPSKTQSKSSDPSKSGDPSNPSESENDPSLQPPSGDKPSSSDSKPGTKTNDPQSGGQQPTNKQTDPSAQPPGQQSPQDANDSDSSDAAGGDSSDQPQSPRSPEESARKRVKQAEDRMRKAQQELEKGNRTEAIQRQKEAEKELKAASEELDRILRQLREEEIERSLKSLESRFRRMLEMQTVVLDETVRLDKLFGEIRDRQLEVGSSKLSLEERKILMEGQRAMLLLQEEGSSMAFPEAVQQMLGDIQMVTDRLGKADVGALTVGIEQEIVSALEEMIDSLVQVQKKMEKDKQQQQQPPGGQPQQQQDKPLVDALAELRLVKTLQLRINSRTQRLSTQLGKEADPIGQAESADLRQQLRELAQRQVKIQEVTREIVISSQE